DIQIRFDWALARPDLIRLIGLEAVQPQPVFLRIDGHGTQSQLGGCAKDADGDLAAVGGQQFSNRFGFLHCQSDQRLAQNPGLFHEPGAPSSSLFDSPEKQNSCERTETWRNRTTSRCGW